MIDTWICIRHALEVIKPLGLTTPQKKCTLTKLSRAESSHETRLCVCSKFRNNIPLNILIIVFKFTLSGQKYKLNIQKTNKMKLSFPFPRVCQLLSPKSPFCKSDGVKNLSHVDKKHLVKYNKKYHLANILIILYNRLQLRRVKLPICNFL